MTHVVSVKHGSVLAGFLAQPCEAQRQIPVTEDYLARLALLWSRRNR